jgi:hypothetical protein
MDVSTRHHVFVRLNAGSSQGNPVEPTLHVPQMSYTSTESASMKTATAGSDLVLGSNIANELRVNVSANDGSVAASRASFQDAQALPLASFGPALVPSERLSVILRVLTPCRRSE